MKIVVLSDIHGDLNLLSLLDKNLSDADVVLLSGDITHFGKTSHIKKIINILKSYNHNILAIPGNCDYPEVNRYLVDQGISLDCRSLMINNVYFMGVGGSLPCPGRTPTEYSEEEFKVMLEETVADNNINGHPVILLVHQPPFNTINDRLNDGFHIGSHSVRQFIEKYQPLICFCGHIHEGIGKDKIGKTIIVNPGPLKMGRYTKVNINSNDVKVEIINMFVS